MHEVAIADALIEQVEQEVRRAGATGRVTRLELSIGRVSGVSVDALRFALELMAAGTIVESARVDIRQPKALCCCSACGARSEIDDLQTRCPRCASLDVVLEGGRDMLLESIELEDPHP
jgi:hydrogenase nickel incorporation protein HypA/HybF